MSENLFGQFSNVGHLIDHWAKEMPNEPAVKLQTSKLDAYILRNREQIIANFDPKDADSNFYSSHSFKQFSENSNRVAQGLLNQRWEKGMRVAVFVKPSFEFFTILFALFKIGAIPVLIDPGIGIRNLKNCLEQAEPQGFIGIPPAMIMRGILGWGNATIEKKMAVFSKKSFLTNFWIGLKYDSLLSSQLLTSNDEHDVNSTAAILFTSGSTGAPKGVVYTHRMFLEQLRLLKETYNIQPGDVDVSTFPLFALFGPVMGMTCVLPQMDFTRPAKAKPENIIHAIKANQATSMFGSPAVVRNLAKFGSDHQIKLPNLKRVISAGAPSEPAVVEQFCQMLNDDVRMFTPYGATESLPVTNVGSDLILETAEQTNRGEGICVGKAVNDVTIKIIRIIDEPVAVWSDDLELPVGEIGEIIVNGPTTTREYFKMQNATELAKIQDPSNERFFHRMGDVGYFDEEGRLWYCGRKSHRVELNGKTLFTIPVERIFNTHKNVFRTALVQTPSGKVALCVQPDYLVIKHEEKKLIEQLKEIGSKFEITKEIEHFLIHTDFPVDVRHNAKIFREKLSIWADGQLK